MTPPCPENTVLVQGPTHPQISGGELLSYRVALQGGDRVAFRAKPPKQLFRSARAMFRSCFFAPITLKKREEKGERKGRKEEKGKEKEGKERIV